MIHTEKLTKRFGNVIAVENLDLDIHEGEVFGILGPNGAGKTTTVRMLSALISPSSGHAVVGGFIVGKQDMQIHHSTGILTESPGLYDNLSAEYNLRFFAALHEVNDITGQVEKYLKMLDLYDRRFDTTGTFSKGMKQKLAIARALLHEPKIIFLDEPTAGLDPEAAHLVREFIIELKKGGRTILICTHNLDEADRLCDRIGVIKNQLLVVDTPTKLRASVFGRKVVFHLRAADPKLEEVIRALPYVREARFINNKLLVNLDDPELRNPDVIRVLVSAGADIQFVGELRHSLEEVYLQLVKA